jgi:hypothetical protein
MKLYDYKENGEIGKNLFVGAPIHFAFDIEKYMESFHNMLINRTTTRTIGLLSARGWNGFFYMKNMLLLRLRVRLRLLLLLSLPRFTGGPAFWRW